jgi:hypothetical protein
MYEATAPEGILISKVLCPSASPDLRTDALPREQDVVVVTLVSVCEKFVVLSLNVLMFEFVVFP